MWALVVAGKVVRVDAKKENLPVPRRRDAHIVDLGAEVTTISGARALIEGGTGQGVLFDDVHDPR